MPSSASRPPRADRRINDQRILQAAARVLAIDPQASISAIADAAGVVRLTVYRRYPDRPALIEAVREAVTADALQALDALPDWTIGMAMLDRLTDTMVGVGRRYPVAVIHHGAQGVRPPSRVDERLVGLLQEGQAAGVLRGDVSPELLNDLMLGAVVAVVRRSLAPGPQAGGPPDSSLVAQVSSVLAAGYAAARQH